jgi:plastocyanin
VFYEGLPLSTVLLSLSEEALKRDPDKQGINFLINPNVVTSAAQTQIDPTTGAPITLPPPEPIDMPSVTVRIAPPLRNLRLADVLDAITKVADKPIRYSIEEYAVVFSQKPPEATQLETRVFKVDPNTFQQGLEAVGVFPLGSLVQSTTGGGGGGIGGGGGGGGGGLPPLPSLGNGSTVIAGPGAYSTTYATPIVLVQAGQEKLSLLNLDLQRHDITSKSGLFDSDLAGLGQTVQVRFKTHLQAGKTYAFFCTLHPGMFGQIVAY